MKLLEECIVDADFFALVLLEFYIKFFWFLVDPTIEVLIIVGKFLLLVWFQPVQQLFFSFFLLLISSLSLNCFSIPWFRIEVTSFKAKEKMLVILCDLEAADRVRQLILIGQLKSIRFVDFEVLVIWRCYESTSLVHNFDWGHYFFVIAGRKESLSCSNIP